MVNILNFSRVFALVVGVSLMCAAQAAQIKGKLIDAATNEPMEFVQVSVTRASDGKIANGGITDVDGAFFLRNIPVGQYELTCQYMGYKPLKISIDITEAKQTADIGTRQMQTDDTELEEVKVMGKSAQMRFELDRKVFDASQSIAAEGGSVTDLLATVPSVEVDNEGTISLRGNSSVTIWINGKASGLTSDNQSDILELMPAESIKQIEVITNPSAKFSPEGTAGIINIILKDDRKQGYYGSVKAGADTEGGYQIGGNINTTGGKMDFAVNLNHRSRIRKGGGKMMRDVYDQDAAVGQQQLLSRLQENGEQEGNHKNFFGRVSLGWRPTEKNEFQINAGAMRGKGDNWEDLDYTQWGLKGHSADSVLYKSNRYTDNDGESNMYHLEFSYRHKWSDTHKLDFSVSTFRWKNDRDALYTQTYEYNQLGFIHAEPETQTSPQYQTQKTGIEDKSHEVQLDYTNTIGGIVRLEGGYKGTFQRNLSPTDTYTGTNETDTQQDKTLYNDFKYNQDTHAFYVTAGGKAGHFSFQGGLRAERWEFETRSMSYAQTFEGQPADNIKKDFFKVFPSAFVSYELSGGNEVQLNYTRRLRRPWGGQLNSFRNISDALNIRFGNPELTPEYTNAFELNYIKMWENGQTLSLSAYLRKTSDGMEHISFSEKGGNVMYNTHANISKSTSAGLELIGKNRISTWLELTTTVNMFHNKREAYVFAPGKEWMKQMTGKDDTEVETEIRGDEQTQFNWNFREIANFSLPWGVNLQATYGYFPKTKSVQGYRKSMQNLDLGLKKSFLNDKLTLNISGRNVLDTRKFRNVIEGDGYRQESERWRAQHVFIATLTWNFGNMLKPKKDRGQGGDDEGGVNYSSDGGEF